MLELILKHSGHAVEELLLVEGRLDADVIGDLAALNRRRLGGGRFDLLVLLLLLRSSFKEGSLSLRDVEFGPASERARHFISVIVIEINLVDLVDVKRRDLLKALIKLVELIRL